ncbi:MAG: tRNA preQ1(34) S-adenosylmethionine ribosyltransferase-isomerase QueA, partial [Alphaproteobacteria bacterium]|nr:tRNA preQ1(34) S-adenosylmethionine ribosyltransferase-isomerase QueA [Alphaproteobacteria bacterium]
DLPALLRAGDLLVVNDTRVVPARLAGRRGAAKIEVTLHKLAGEGCWLAFARPAKRLAVGDALDFADGFAATVAEKREAGEVLLDFGTTTAAVLAALHHHGSMPLPPYIERPGGAEARDAEDYQTLFAAREGAVAAPTAGLHFTPGLLAQLEGAGIGVARLTLHVGAGTFQPVRGDDPAAHRMHAETGEITAETASRINAARAAGGRVVAVGTTVTRLLEATAREDGTALSFAGDVDLYIRPGFRFRAIDGLLTNFHLPRSTLFLLVCAFAGTDFMQAAYAHAIAAGYRFYSYGDAMLLWRGRP